MFYLVVFVILVLLAILNVIRADRGGNRILIGIAALLLIGVAGLRYETGGDWPNYNDLFIHVPPIDQFDILHYNNYNCEIGFSLICSLIKWLGGDVQTLFFIVCVFNITLITAGLCRYTKYPVLGMMCYYGILYFNLEMIYIRQAMTVAICFWAIHCIEDRQPIRYVLWVIAACLIHRMAIVMVLLYPMVRIKLPTWTYAVVVGVGAIAMLANITWITSVFETITHLLGGGYEYKAHSYTEAGMFSVNRTLSIGFALNLMIYAVVLFFRKELEQKRYGTLHLNMFTLSLVLYYYCYELIEVSNRFRLFFLISIIALLPLLLESMHERNKKVPALAVIILYTFSFSQGIFLESPKAAAYNPYQNYIVYKLQEKPSTGMSRLIQSNNAFGKERRR